MTFCVQDNIVYNHYKNCTFELVAAFNKGRWVNAISLILQTCCCLPLPVSRRLMKAWSHSRVHESSRYINPYKPIDPSHHGVRTTTSKSKNILKYLKCNKGQLCGCYIRFKFSGWMQSVIFVHMTFSVCIWWQQGIPKCHPSGHSHLMPWVMQYQRMCWLSFILYIWHSHLWPLLLTWFNFNPSMDK